MKFEKLLEGLNNEVILESESLIGLMLLNCARYIDELETINDSLADKVLDEADLLSIIAKRCRVRYSDVYKDYVIDISSMHPDSEGYAEMMALLGEDEQEIEETTTEEKEEEKK